MIAVVLWNAESWSSLMVVVTGYNLLGYMAAPISMGAIKPKTRVYGVIVFVILGLIMTTLPKHDLFMMIISLVVLMVIYGGVQLTKKNNFLILLGLITPFMGYLAMIYVYQNLIYVGVVSFLFYLFITSVRFVQFCKKYKTEGLSFEDEL
jgi:CDP-diglyceride synthetase